MTKIVLAHYESRTCRTGEGDSAPISLGSFEEDTAPLTEKSTTSVTSIPESDEEEENLRASVLGANEQVLLNFPIKSFFTDVPTKLQRIINIGWKYTSKIPQGQGTS